MTAKAASRMRLDQEALRPQMRMPWFTPLLGTFLRKMPAQIMPTGAGTLTCQRYAVSSTNRYRCHIQNKYTGVEHNDRE